MPTAGRDLHTRERAERRCARAARARRWRTTGSCSSTCKAEPGALRELARRARLAAYLALGRTREAGYVLLGLRPLRGGAAALSRAGAAARVGALRGAAGPARRGGAGPVGERPPGAGGDRAGGGRGAARRPASSGSACCAIRGSAGRPYETALATSTWARRCCASAIARAPRARSRRRSACWRRRPTTSRPAASRSARSTATASCFASARRPDSFENVSEGYLNAIRVLAAEDQLAGRAVLRRLRRLRRRAGGVARGGDGGARGGRLQPAGRGKPTTATTWARRRGLDRGGARQPDRDGPLDLSANALHAAIDAATALGDLALCGRLYAELAELPLVDEAAAALSAAGAALRGEPAARPPAVGFPRAPAPHRRATGHLATGPDRAGSWRASRRRCWPGTSPITRLRRANIRAHALRALLLCGSSRVLAWRMCRPSPSWR